MSLIRHLAAALEAYDQEDDDRHAEIVALLTQTKELTMALQKEVQDLHDAVAALGEQITAATTEIDALQDQVVDLNKKLEDAHAAGNGISAEDLAEIVAATSAISSGVQKIKEAMPAPIATPVVDAAAQASDQPQP